MVLQLSNSAEIFPRFASEREQETAPENTFFFGRFLNVSKFYTNRLYHKRGLMIKLHFQSLDMVDSTFHLILVPVAALGAEGCC